MRLVAIADTHIPDRCLDVPDALFKELQRADLIVHAGDFTSAEYFKYLRSLKPLKAALGNLDVPGLREFLKEKEVFTIQKFKIGVMHGFGSAENVLLNIRKSFDDSFDLVIFGHTHNSYNEKIGKTIFFNPGSPTDKVFASHNSYGIIEIQDTIETAIVRL
jgi:putative phosphoesterase